jgi:hypothetical protein
MRPAPFQCGEKLLGGGHLSTVAHADSGGVRVLAVNCAGPSRRFSSFSVRRLRSSVTTATSPPAPPSTSPKRLSRRGLRGRRAGIRHRHCERNATRRASRLRAVGPGLGRRLQLRGLEQLRTATAAMPQWPIGVCQRLRIAGSPNAYSLKSHTRVFIAP